ncbi:MAG: hypothetical protein RLZZ524_473 [Pseudomonadota bacterium]|jgi:hypothetical protein
MLTEKTALSLVDRITPRPTEEQLRDLLRQALHHMTFDPRRNEVLNQKIRDALDAPFAAGGGPL